MQTARYASHICPNSTQCTNGGYVRPRVAAVAHIASGLLLYLYNIMICFGDQTDLKEAYFSTPVTVVEALLHFENMINRCGFSTSVASIAVTQQLD